MRIFYSNQNKRVVKLNETFRVIVQNMLESNNQKFFQKNNNKIIIIIKITNLLLFKVKKYLYNKK